MKRRGRGYRDGRLHDDGFDSVAQRFLIMRRERAESSDDKGLLDGGDDRFDGRGFEKLSGLRNPAHVGTGIRTMSGRCLPIDYP